MFDLVTNTWGKDNSNIFGTYSRLYVHIAICNDFIRLIDNGAPGAEADLAQYRLEARALRALTYYWVVDLFGKGGFVDENTDGNPKQISRLELYNWLKTELVHHLYLHGHKLVQLLDSSSRCLQVRSSTSCIVQDEKFA